MDCRPVCRVQNTISPFNRGRKSPASADSSNAIRCYIENRDPSADCQIRPNGGGIPLGRLPDSAKRWWNVNCYTLLTETTARMPDYSESSTSGCHGMPEMPFQLVSLVSDCRSTNPIPTCVFCSFTVTQFLQKDVPPECSHFLLPSVSVFTLFRPLHCIFVSLKDNGIAQNEVQRAWTYAFNR
ncbi:unnamed protein product [Protopolystoma xenopodis]|uniref:Uncharacterized protein n=1 Tax=Protopolystoma xenopodis TaxID=117903 RepID=A0A448XNF2_9PLAT|nr:unnamed protein product [Protopolystoma xenopodis]